MRQENCQTVDLILVKTHVEASGLTIIAIHHEYLTPLFDMSVGKTTFCHNMHYDHDYMMANFLNARVYDLTNYPFTINPESAPKASLSNVDTFSRYEIIGIRDEDVEQGNGIFFDTVLYEDHCPLHAPKITSKLRVEVASVKIVYFYEMSFRIIDYFMDKFLWALTESRPYMNLDNAGNMIDKSPIDLQRMSAE